MLQQTVFWICRAAALLLLCLGVIFGLRREEKGIFALLYGVMAAFLFQYVLLPFVHGWLEGFLGSILPEAMLSLGLPLGLLLATALYEMLAFTLLALPMKNLLSPSLAGSFAFGYWGCTILYLLVSDLMAYFGSQSILFAGTVLDSLCAGLVPLLNLTLYFCLARTAAALVSGGRLSYFFKGILWNLIYRMILALPVLFGTEDAIAIALGGLWGILLLIYAIRAGRSIITLEGVAELLPEEELVEEGEEAQEDPLKEGEDPAEGDAALAVQADEADAEHEETDE